MAHRPVLVGHRHVVVGDAVEEERLDLEDPGLLLAQHGLGSIPLGGGRTDDPARPAVISL
jgi:hypothetical protein